MAGGSLIAVLVSLIFPGVGQGIASHRLRMLAWAVAALVPVLLIVVSVWFLPVMLLLRVAGVVDAYRCLKRLPALQPRINANAVIAVVIGAIGIAYADVAIEAFKIPSSSMYPTLIIGDHIYVDKLSLRWRPPERGEIIVFTQPCAKRVYVKRLIARGGDTIEVRCGNLIVNGAQVGSSLVAERTAYKDLDAVPGREWFVRETSRYREHLGDRTYDTFHDVGRPAAQRSATPITQGDFPDRDRPFPPACTASDFFDQPSTATRQPTGRIVETKPATAHPCEPQLHFVLPPGALFVMGDNRNNANDSRYWGLVSEDAVLGRASGIWMSNGAEGGWSRFGAVE